MSEAALPRKVVSAWTAKASGITWIAAPLPAPRGHAQTRPPSGNPGFGGLGPGRPRAYASPAGFDPAEVRHGEADVGRGVALPPRLARVRADALLRAGARDDGRTAGPDRA